MKTKIRMWALPMLLALLLVSVVVVPAVSAQSEVTKYASDSGNEFKDIMEIENISLPLIKSDILSIDSKNYNEPMTKEEFEKENAEYIKFLNDRFGDKALKIIDNAYLTSNSKSTKSSTSILHIGSYDMYLWPYFNSQTSTSSNNGGINAIFFDKNVDEMASILKDTGNWGSALGWTEWGLHGPNLDNMVWTNSPGSNPNGNHQLEDGSYYGNRYHLVMTEGHLSSSIGDDWCYGNCHYEYWDWDDRNHYLYPDSLDSGRDHLYDELSNDASISWINMENAWSGYFDGWGYIFDMD